MPFTIGSLVSIQQYESLGPGLLLKDNDDPYVLLLHRDGARRPLTKADTLQPYPLPAGLFVRVRSQSLPAGIPGEIVREVTGEADPIRKLVVLMEGEEATLPESFLVPDTPQSMAFATRLKCLNWDLPQHFFARRGLLQALSGWYEESEGLPTLTGSRVYPVGHQLYAVQRVLWSRTPRFVLADEVGLGKTIEAGLIVQALMAANPDLSVLILAPGAMTRQWLGEVYLRFGARAFTLAKSPRDILNPQVIVSASQVAQAPSAWRKLAQKRWGMVIIDEAHQFPPSHPLYELFHQIACNCDGILVLSATPSKRQSKGLAGLLALVAPERYSPHNTNVIDQLFSMRQGIWDRLLLTQQLRNASDADEVLADPDTLEMLYEEWSSLLTDDPIADALLTKLQGGDRTALDELEAYVREHYRVDHRIIRTRRKTLNSMGHAWCERVLEAAVRYTPSAHEQLLTQHFEEALPSAARQSAAHRALCGVYQRLLVTTPALCLERLRMRQTALHSPHFPRGEDPSWWDALLSEPSPEEETLLKEAILQGVTPFDGEVRWLKQAISLAESWQAEAPVCRRHQAAAQWIQQHLQEHPTHKLLIFAEDWKVVDAFSAVLSRLLRGTVEGCHWKSIDKLEEIALRFQRQPSRPVLVLDETGGEGRNFQMAEAVMHLETPWSIARSEQRIGRLDRMGRETDRPVRSVVLLGEGSVEAGLHQIHAQTFKVYEQSIGGLEFVLPDLQQRISTGAAEGGQSLQTVIPDLTREITDALDQADGDFEMALDTTRTEMKAAEEAVELIQDIEHTDRRDPIKYWAHALGMKCRWADRRGNDPNHGHDFKWEDNQLVHPLDGLSNGGSGQHYFHGTFDHELAMERENLQFFGPGHVLIDALLRALETTPVGQFTVMARELGTPHRHKPFLNVLVRFTLDPTLWGDTPISAGLLTRARRRLYPETNEVLLRLELGEAPEAHPIHPIKNRPLKQKLEKDYQGRRYDRVLPRQVLAQLFPLQPLADAIENGIAVALKEATRSRQEIAEEAQEDFKKDLSSELGFLRGRLQRGEGDPEEIASEIQQREVLLNGLMHSRAEIAGVALVIGF